MDTLKTIFEDMRFKGYRLTRSRKAVVRVIVEADDWLRPEEVHTRAQSYCPSLGLVTVYRTLALLSALGYVRRVHREDGCQGYARTELTHGHHLICRGCDQVVEFPGFDSLSALIKPIEHKTGFIIDDHVLELLGLCPACQVGASR